MASGGSNFVQNLTNIIMDFTFLDAPTHSTDETLPTDLRIFRHAFLINAKFKQHTSFDYTTCRSSYVKHGVYITSMASYSYNVEVNERAVVQLPRVR